MASSYDNDLRLNEQGTGDNSGSWGTVTNLNLEMIAEAFSYGTRAIANAASDNITLADGALDADRSMYLRLSGGGQACTVTFLPATISKVWLIENATSATLTMKQGSNDSGIAIPAGQVKMIATDGGGSTNGVVYDLLTDVNLAGTTVMSGATIDDVAIDGKVITMTGSSGDTATLTVAADGALAIATTDAAAAAANISITADGTFTATGTTITLDSAGDIILDADGADVIFKDGGTAIGTITNASSDLVIKSNVQDKDILLKGDDGGTEITALSLDMSAGGNALFSGTVTRDLTRGSIDVGNSSGVSTSLAAGGAGTVLTSDGTDLSFAAAASSSTGFFLNALQKNIAARTGGIDIVVDALLDENGIGAIDEAGYVSGTLTLSTSETTHPDPVLTSNTAPSPYVASGQYTGSQSFKAWLSNSNYVGAYQSNTQWIQLDIGSAKIATSYKMALSITGTYNTTSHTFSGSNSADGSSSTTLATNSSASNSFRTFSNSTAFRYYRLNATGNGGFGTGQVWQNSAFKTTKDYPFNIETVSYATGSVKTSVTVGVYATTNGSENLNTTLKALVSRDGGSNYTTSSTLSLKTTTPDGKKYFQADDVDISGIASGTNLKLKIVVTNNTCTALHGWVLDWS